MTDAKRQRERERREYLREQFRWEQRGGFGPDPYGLPRCDSPIEDALVSVLMKHKAADAIVLPQFEALGYRLDFVLRQAEGSRAVGFECDGAEYHRDRQIEDKRRDRCLLLGTTRPLLERLYRFEGRAIHHMAEACLYVVSLFDPWVFPARAHKNLDTLAARFVDPSVLSSALARLDHPANRAREGRVLLHWVVEDERLSPTGDRVREAWVTVRARSRCRLMRPLDASLGAAWPADEY